MKKIAVALLLMCVQNSYSTLKDTLQNEHRFEYCHRLMCIFQSDFPSFPLYLLLSYKYNKP